MDAKDKIRFFSFITKLYDSTPGLSDNSDPSWRRFYHMTMRTPEDLAFSVPLSQVILWNHEEERVYLICRTL